MALALTSKHSSRGEECKIPELIDAVLPELGGLVSTCKVGQVGFFDPIFYYGWALPGWRSPLGVNVALLCSVLNSCEQDAGKAVGEFLAGLGDKFNTSTAQAGVLLDLEELRCVGDNKVVGNTGVSYGELAQLLSPFQQKKSPKVPEAFSCILKTVGMNKYGVSSRATPLRRGWWKPINDKTEKRLARSVTLCKVTALKTQAQEVKTRVEEKSADIAKLSVNLFRTVATLVESVHKCS